MPTVKISVDSVKFQERDLTLLRGLFESRVMTAGHIRALYFDGKKEAAKKRLQKLKSVGLVGERRRNAFEPAILFLTRKAFTLLHERGVLAEYPPLDRVSLDKRSRVSELTLRHELEVMDVKTAFHSAIKTTEKFSVEEFSTWPSLYQFEAFRTGYGDAQVPVKPDGFIRIHEKESGDGLSEHAFFLEVDRSSEIQDILASKASCYLDYYKSGGFAEKNGGQCSDYQKFPFRVLIVFKNAERRNNTAERLLQNKPPILALTYLSTFEEVTTNPLGEIWIRPIDYRDATKGTPFESQKQRETWGYARQTAREIFVESKIKKCRILMDEVEPPKSGST